MQEELEAADWYDQRVDAATDRELKAILAHNRDEEKEHFVMLLEWLRRRDAKFATELHNRSRPAARSSRPSRRVRATRHRAAATGRSASAA